MSKVYCMNCEHLSGRLSTAEAGCNLIKVTYEDSWYGPDTVRMPETTVLEKNKDNDCKDFEPFDWKRGT